jgi:hypothetical protein
MYLGKSAVHSSTVARVLNLRIWYITTQYNTMDDNLFSTVHNYRTALGILTPEFWNGLLRIGLEDNVVADYDRVRKLITPPPFQNV